MPDHKVPRVAANAIHVVPDLGIRAGGLSRAAVDISSALAELDGWSVKLIGGVAQGGTALPLSARVGQHIVPADVSRPLRTALNFRCTLKAAGIRSAQILHNHGLWSSANTIAACTALARGVQLITQPHGMLEPWALEQGRLKKAAALSSYQGYTLAKSSALVATSEQEYMHLRRLELRAPIAIIPNGHNSPNTGSRDLPASPEPRDRRVLFLSRVHPKKGLLNLMHAWAAVEREGWTLHIAGPDEGDHLRELVALTRRLGIASSVNFIGEVEGAIKNACFASADLFVLPTHSENFGIAVVEALSYGIPVITTKGAPWESLRDQKCGWWIDIGVVPLIAALKSAMDLTDVERRDMGVRARELASTFAWPRAAAMLNQLYMWVLGAAARPTFVHVG